MITKEMFISDAKTLTPKEMAKKYDVGLNSIYRKSYKLGIRFISSRTVCDIEQIAKDWETMNCEQIMIKHKISRPTAFKYKKNKRPSRKFDF